MRLVIFCTFALSFLSLPYRVSAQSGLSSLNNKKGETPCTLAMTLKYRCPNHGDSRPYDANYTNDPREQLTQIYPTDCTCNLVFYNLWSGCWLLTGLKTPTFKTWGDESCQNASVPVSRLPSYDLSDAPDWVFRNVTSNSTFDEIGAINLSSHPVQSTVKIVFIAFAVVLFLGLSAVFCYILWRRRRSSKEKWWDEVPSLRTPRKFFGLVSDVQRVRPISLRHTWSIEDDDNGKLNYTPSSADTGSRFAQFTSRVFRLSPFFDALLKRLPSSRRKRDQTIWRIDPLWLYETSGTHSQHQNLLGHPSPDDASAKKYKDTVPEINIVLVADADRGTEIEHTPPPQRQHASRPSESWRDTFLRLSQPRPGIAEAVATDANCSIEQPSSPSPLNLSQDVEVPYNIGGETRSNPRTPHWQRDAPKPSRRRSILKSKMWEPHSPPAGVDPRAHSGTSRPVGQPSSERPPSIVPVAQLSPPARGDATAKLSPLPPPSTTFINTSVPSLPLYPSRAPAPRLPAPRGHDRFLSREMNSR